MKKIYVCGPLTSYGLTHDNLRRACQAHAELIYRGFAPFTPHLQAFVAMVQPITEDRAMSWCRQWLPLCSGVLLLEGWRNSRGALEEMDLAEELGILTFESVEELCLNRELL